LQGYAEHVVATATEWMVAVLSVLFFGTFYPEFKHFKLHAPRLEYRDDTCTTNSNVEPQVNVAAPRLEYRDDTCTTNSNVEPQVNVAFTPP